jgi:uncharacterized repeat protein (TIGR02543 family)
MDGTLLGRAQNMAEFRSFRRKWAYVAAAAVLAAALCIMLPAGAGSDSEADITYEVSDGAATVTGYDGDDSVLDIPGTLGGATVTAIGNDAFLNCTSLTSVTIPDSVTVIGPRAFMGCTALTTVSFGTDSQLTTIESEAFADDTSLTLSITSTVFAFSDSAADFATQPADYWPGSAFRGVQNVTIADSSTYYTEDCGDGKIIRSSNTVFAYCGNPTSYTVPAAVTIIGGGALQGCDTLTSLTFADRTSSLYFRSLALADTGITDLTLPEYAVLNSSGMDSNYAMGPGSAFRGIQNITFASGSSYSVVTEGCEGGGLIVNASTIYAYFGSPTSVDLSQCTTYYDTIGRNAFQYCSTLTSMNFFPDGRQKTLVEDAFAWCTGLTSLEISSSVMSIADRAFYECTSLISIKATGSLSYLSGEAFGYCTGLKSAVLPSTISRLNGNSVFLNCSSLEFVVFPSTTTNSSTTLSHLPTAFSGCSSIKVIYTSEEFYGYFTGLPDTALRGDPTQYTLDGEAEEGSAAVLGTADTDGAYLYLDDGTAGDSASQENMRTSFTGNWGETDYVFSVKDGDGSSKWFSIEEPQYHCTVNFSGDVSGKDPFYAFPGEILDQSDWEETFGDWAGTGQYYEGTYTDSSFTSSYEWGQQLTAGITLYVHFLYITYNVIYDSDGGSSVEGRTGVAYNETVTLPSASAVQLTGYTLSGWLCSSDSQTYDPGEEVSRLTTENGADVTLTAQWQINQYTITFDSAEGSDVDPITADYNSEVQAPDAPTKQGYTFYGWQDEDQNAVTFPITMPAENVTLVAVWTPNPYEVSFAVEPTDAATLSGTIETADYGTSVSVSSDGKTLSIGDTEITFTQNDPVEGYDFSGWQLNGASIESGSTISETNVFTAVFEANTFTISFDSNGGSDVDPITADYNESITAPDDPTKTGYTFAGWLKDGEVFEFNTMPAADITLTADWDAESVSLTFESNNAEYGSVSPSSGTALYGSVVEVGSDGTLTIDGAEASVPAASTGYHFARWLLDGAAVQSGSTTVGLSGTFTAVFEVGSYSINFDSAGGSEVESITADYGAEISAPADPTRHGYTFSGWLKDGVSYTIPSTMPAENITLTASWDPVSCDVTFAGVVDTGVTFSGTMTQADYGTAVSVSSDGTTLTIGSSTVTFTSSSEAGYTFVEWQLNGADIASGATIGDENAFTAVFTVNSFTIYFDSAGGSEVESITADYGAEISAPDDPTRHGYTFDGWLRDGSSYEIPSAMPAESFTLIASWTPVQCPVTYAGVVDEGATFEGAVGTAPYGVPLSLSTDGKTLRIDMTQITAVPSSEAGYTFVKWQLNGADIVPGSLISDTNEITAVFAVNSFAIDFSTGGGTPVDPITADYGAAISAPADPTRAGHTFAGWMKGDSLYTFPDTMPAESFTLTAAWDIETYHVYFYADGELVATEEYTVEDTDIEVPEVPSKLGFEGVWEAYTLTVGDVTVNAVYTDAHEEAQSDMLLSAFLLAVIIAILAYAAARQLAARREEAGWA